MQIRSFVLAPRSRAANVALLVAVVGVGAVLLVFGLALLLGLAAVGTVAAIGTLAWRRLTGAPHPVAPHPGAPPERSEVLDPRLEIPASDAHLHVERARLPRVVDE